MAELRSLAGRLAYGGVFTLLVPAALVGWALAAGTNVHLPGVRSTPVGASLAVLGVVLLLAGWASLWRFGGGLPMNAFPPPRFVACGPYRVVRDPIYVGFCTLIVGVSLWAGSAAGLWLVAPMTTLACAALVWGYERIDLTQRFGEAAQRQAWLSMAIADDARPTFAQRLGTMLIVWAPWLLAYEALLHAGPPHGAIDAYLPFEHRWPVIEWAELPYASAYLLVPLTPWLCRSQRDLRLLTLRGWTLTLILGLVMLVAPFVASPRPFVPTSSLGRLLMWERVSESASGAAAFPSFHAAWAMFAAAIASRRNRALGVIGWGWAAAVVASCVATGMHALVDVFAAAMLFPLAWRADRLWNRARSLAERLSNAFVEWRVGPLRVLALNAGFAALAGALAAFLMLALAGPEHGLAIFAVALAGVIGAAIWAQMVEAGSGLARPFGYYGSVVGGIAACTVVQMIDGSGWRIGAALAVAAAPAQAIGRLRCLVQGCCHGRPCDDPTLAIRVTHRRSRVVHLAKLGGVPIHPTPLYSILANLAVAVVLARLWIDAAPTSVVLGVYLMLAGVTRFVEESFRGEPQTPAVAGLALYHWAALASFVLGAIATCIRAPAAGGIALPSAAQMLGVILFGVGVGGAMGVDVPGSRRRFSRLAPVDEGVTGDRTHRARNRIRERRRVT